MANSVNANIAIKQKCDSYYAYSFHTFILIPVSVMYCVSEPIFLFRPVTYFYNQWLYRVWMVSQVSPLFYTLVGFILYVSLGEWLCVCFFGLVCCFRSQATAMVMLRKSVHITTLFSWVSLNKQLTKTSCTYLTFACN